MTDAQVDVGPALTSREVQDLWKTAWTGMLSLGSGDGILASSRHEAYGCLFGRDAMITSMFLLDVTRRTGDQVWLPMIRRSIERLAELQGRVVNVESGEQPGKIIHEYRPDHHEHLTRNRARPWYVYPDGRMRIYDSVDSTPLFLIAVRRYAQLTGDQEFVEQLMPAVRAALAWLLDYGDQNGDGFIDFRMDPKRQHGGLTVHNWMDSSASLFREDGRTPILPVAPVEVQAYSWLAGRLWQSELGPEDSTLSTRIAAWTRILRQRFNRYFVRRSQFGLTLAMAVDGRGDQIDPERSAIGHCLWAALRPEFDEVAESILEPELLTSVATRLMQPDLFEPRAGFRTLSTASRCFEPMSYHNGSIWPHDTAMIIEGLRIFGFDQAADQAGQAMLRAFRHYRENVELFVVDNSGYAYFHDQPSTGHHHRVCHLQAWSAAALLNELSWRGISPAE